MLFGILFIPTIGIKMVEQGLKSGREFPLELLNPGGHTLFVHRTLIFIIDGQSHELIASLGT
jgi:hypothetical protein